MPLIANFTDKWGQTHAQAWSYIAVSNFDFERKQANLELWTYTSKADAYAGRPPIDKHTITLTSTETPAQYGAPTLVSPYVPAVYSEPDENGQVHIVTPAVDPVYSDAPLVAPAVPSFGSELANNAQAYGALEASLAALAKNVLIALADATWEPVDPVA